MLYYPARPDMDSGDSSLNASREDLSVAVGPLDRSTKPPSFDSSFARPGTLPSLSPSPVTSDATLPSPSPNSTPSLPGYSDSLPVPDYRPNPTGGEQRLEFVPRGDVCSRNIGVWTKRIKDMTITIHDQDPIEVQHAPRYGRRGIIRGTIEFDEENLATFEKVKLVVRLLVIYPPG
jgi:hypothetical protein